MRPASLFLVLLLAALPLFAQAPPAIAGSDDLPKLEHLSASQVNPQFDPCVDFYQYTCSKFFAANPIPPDRATWGVIGPLRDWNDIILRQTLEAAAAKKQGRTASEQKIGDFWSSCMDETKIESSSLAQLKPELKRIDDLKDKSQLAGEIARQHSTVYGAWNG